MVDGLHRQLQCPGHHEPVLVGELHHRTPDGVPGRNRDVDDVAERYQRNLSRRPGPVQRHPGAVQAFGTNHD